MSQITVPQLVVLDNLAKMYSRGEKMLIPKSHLLAAFPLKKQQVDFKLVHETLALFGFMVMEGAVDDAHWVLIRRKPQTGLSERDRAA